MSSDEDREAHLRRSFALEEACDFAGAARAASLAGDLSRAAPLASLSGDAALMGEVVEVVARAGSEAAARAAEDCASRGHHGMAAQLFLRGERFQRAGESFAAANAPVEAALAFERAGRPGDGAKVLDAALRVNPSDHRARRSLAELLARHGRVEAAVRALQALPVGHEERRAGLPLLARSLTAMGLVDAAREITEEMKAQGLDPTSAAPLEAVPSKAAAGVVLFGRFEILSEVAQTPHARLVRAFDRVGQREVAVKLLATTQLGTGRDALVRFEREARALAQLNHPAVVPLVAYVPEGPAMALEWMSGGSLADLLAREQLAPARAAEIAGSVLHALGVAHRLGILHRDVKPSNVLFDAIGAPRLSDFGAAHLGDGQNTATAGAIGTFAYMSPEQRLGRPATVQSDVFSAGALLYEMITGEAAEPLEGPTFEDLPPSAFHPDLGPAHDAVLATMLAREPAGRPLDAFEARRALDGLTWPRDVVPRAGPPSGRTRTSVPPPSRPERLAAAHTPGDGRDADRLAHDTWTSRDVIVVPLTAGELERARAFARAPHEALPVILRASRAEGSIWVDRPRGVAVADGATLTAPLLATLDEALRALHALGAGHGAIDDAHLYVEGEALTLAYPRTEPAQGHAADGAAADAAGDAARDRAALERLAARITA